MGDYRSAMNHEKEALSAFTSLYGEDHPQRRCSYEFLRSITQQAVRVERSLRQGGNPLTAEGQSLSPSAETTLEQLALVTGIRTPSHSDRLLEFKQKLMEQREAEEAANAKPDNTHTETVNGKEVKTPEREEEEDRVVQETTSEELPEEIDPEKNTADKQTADGHQMEVNEWSVDVGSAVKSLVVEEGSAVEGSAAENKAVESGAVVESSERDGDEDRAAPETEQHTGTEDGEANLMATEEMQTEPVRDCIEESQSLTQNGGLESEGNQSDNDVEVANEKPGSDKVSGVNGTPSTSNDQSEPQEVFANRDASTTISQTK